MTRDERVKRVIYLAPESAQKSLARAFSGSASPRQAIKAMCMSCCGFDREAIRKCSGFSCPLWEYRPFRDDGPDEAGGVE